VRGRLLFALGFVVVVVALILLRDRGYLGGRQLGGPLQIGAGGVALVARPGEAAFAPLGGRLSGGSVQVQNVRPRVVSPELEVIGPRLEQGGPLEGSSLESGAFAAKLGLRAQRAGFYYAIGLITDYRRGQRRFRDREDQSVCIAIRMKAHCDPGYEGPGDARVAQVGGPSRYRHARLQPDRARYEKPGPYGLRLTVANQTRSAIDVADLRLDDNALDVEVTTAEPTSFHLPPHGYRVVKIHLRFPACKAFALTFSRLRARLDGEKRSIPLSLPLEFGCPAP
jgi:hypothetical protein